MLELLNELGLSLNCKKSNYLDCTSTFENVLVVDMARKDSVSRCQIAAPNELIVV